MYIKHCGNGQLALKDLPHDHCIRTLLCTCLFHYAILVKAEQTILYTFFPERHLRRGGGGGSSNRGNSRAESDTFFFFFFFFSKWGAHVQKKRGGAFIEFFSKGGGHEPAVPPPLNPPLQQGMTIVFIVQRL